MSGHEEVRQRAENGKGTEAGGDGGRSIRSGEGERRQDKSLLLL